jgi:SAM-dependent methyltransferase
MHRPFELIDQKSHFAFGKNWESYAQGLTDAAIEQATVNLRRLAGGGLEGKRFLDIGCGSGVHSLAALRLGASEVLAVDLDPDSVATTRKLLSVHAHGQRWSVVERSVFELLTDCSGTYDVVYSWGVLHHTGDMLRALRVAATLVAPGGEFMFALYHRTHLCWFWKTEKRWYAGASRAAQARARAVYLAVFRLLHRRTFTDYVATYATKRGMDFYHDVHDWLGGWPYESILPAETDDFMRQLGMRRVKGFLISEGKTSGLMGSGCDEYVYRRE